MPNIMRGRGQLQALLPPQAEFEVDYEIHFVSKPLGRGGVGLPRVERTTIAHASIRATDGRLIPQGQYILTNGQTELLRLAKDFGKWYGLNRT
jgi:hypothetical protein